MSPEESNSPTEVREMLYAGLFAPAAYGVVTLCEWMLMGLFVEGFRWQDMFPSHPGGRIGWAFQVIGPCVGGVLAFPAVWCVMLPLLILITKFSRLTLKRVVAVAIAVAWPAVAMLALLLAWMHGPAAGIVTFGWMSVIAIPGSCAVAILFWTLYSLFTGAPFWLVPRLQLDDNERQGNSSRPSGH